MSGHVEHTRAVALTRGIIVLCDDVAGYDKPVLCEWSWCAHDPLAVTVTFTEADEDTGERRPGSPATPWVFGRDLVAAVFEVPGRRVGEGDVRLLRHEQELSLLVESAEGSAVVATTAGTVFAWLAKTFEVVAPGAEVLDVDWDAELRSIVEGAS